MTQEKLLVIEDFLRIHCEFLTCEQMAEELYMPYDTAYSHLKRLGLKPISAAQQARNTIQELGPKKTVGQLAKMLGTNEDHVVRMCKELEVVPFEKSDSSKVSISDRLNSLHYDVSRGAKGKGGEYVLPWTSHDLL